MGRRWGIVLLGGLLAIVGFLYLGQPRAPFEEPSEPVPVEVAEAFPTTALQEKSSLTAVKAAPRPVTARLSPKVDTVANAEVHSVTSATETQTYELRGRVVDSVSGEGIANAHTSLLCVERLNTTHIEHKIIADEEGRFVVTDLDAGLYNFEATADGYLPHKHEQHRREYLTEIADGEDPPEEIVIELDPETYLDIDVHHADGSPAADVLVNPYPFTPDRSTSSFEPYITDSTGYLRIMNPHHSRTGHVEAYVTAGHDEKHRVWDTIGRSEDFQMSKGQNRSIDIVIPETGSLSGRVETESGVPLGNMPLELSVRSAQLNSSCGRSTRSNSQGVFIFNDVPEGTASVFAHSDGYVTSWRRNLLVSAGKETSGVIVTVKQAESIRGVLLNSDLKPMDEVTVMARPMNQSVQSSGADSTNNRGEFEINTLLPGEYRLEAVTKYRTQVVEGVPAGTEGLYIIMDPDAVVFGSVRDAKSGAPITGFSVRGHALDNYHEVSNRNAQVTVPTTPDGTFRIEGVLPGHPYTLLIEKDGYAKARFEVADLKPGEEHGPVAIDMHHGYSLTGHVTRGDTGEPLCPCEVLIRKAPGNGERAAPTLKWTSRTNHYGKFKFEHIPPGSFELVILDDNDNRVGRQAPLIVRGIVVNGHADLGVFQTAPGARLKGHVTVPDDLLRRNVFMKLNQNWPHITISGSHIAPDGSYEIGAIPAGIHTVQICTVDLRRGLEIRPVQEESIMFTEGQTVMRDFEIEPVRNTPSTQ